MSLMPIEAVKLKDNLCPQINLKASLKILIIISK